MTVAIETDLAKNAAADKALAIIMGDNDDYDALDGLVKEAGKALANRYCFALTHECGEGYLAMITPIRFFKESGCCDDQSGPISGLLPNCAETSEATWEVNDPSAKTPLGAAKYLQSLGFVWDRGFQDFIDKSHTPELKTLEQSPQKPVAKPKQPRP